MKKILLFFIITTYYSFLVAQVPERMTYQAVLRDHQNQLVTNQRIGMQISILDDFLSGTAYYVEEQTVTTNAHGLVSVEIGSGTLVSGSMAAIPWEDDNLYIQTEIDLNGGSSYTLVNAVQLSTVPYAFHAKTADSITHPTPETDPIFIRWNYEYNALNNRPIIPINVSQLNNDAGYLTSFTERDSIFLAWGYNYDSLQNVPAVRLRLDSVLATSNDGGGKRIENIADPINAQDAVTKISMESYVTNSTQLRVSYTNDTLFLGPSQWVLIPGVSAATYSPPTVTTVAISDITSVSATSGGDVTSDGNLPVTAGVCWSTSLNPTILNTHTTDGNGLGTFTSSLTPLTANTTYYVRAYATNSVGTAYGNAITFTTLPLCSAGVTDTDNNHYDGVEIGTQCWIKQNLRVTKYADGTSIDLVTSTNTVTSTTIAYRYYPNNDINNVSIYGYLYNWPAVMGAYLSSSDNPSGIQGVCPDGWHVPSDAEWDQLVNYLGGSSVAGGPLKHTSYWNSPNTEATNATGFGAVPAGFYRVNYFDFGSDANLWSATEENSESAYTRNLNSNNAGVLSYSHFGKDNAFSVRCLRDY